MSDNDRHVDNPVQPEEEFPEKGMTFQQFAQHVIPGLSDKEADHVLWERTPFPIVLGRDDLMPYLVKERDRLTAGGGMFDD